MYLRCREPERHLTIVRKRRRFKGNSQLASQPARPPHGGAACQPATRPKQSLTSYSTHVMHGWSRRPRAPAPSAIFTRREGGPGLAWPLHGDRRQAAPMPGHHHTRPTTARTRRRGTRSPIGRAGTIIAQTQVPTTLCRPCFATARKGTR